MTSPTSLFRKNVYDVKVSVMWSKHCKTKITTYANLLANHMSYLLFILSQSKADM